MEGEPVPARLVVMRSDELFLETMLRVPARQLRRFQFLSRRWRALLSDRNFLIRHTRHHCAHRTSETAFIIYAQSQIFCFNPTTRELGPFTFHTAVTTVLQSSHGLMLLKCRDSNSRQQYYCVANPVTKKARRLVIPQEPTRFHLIEPLYLEFDPSISEFYGVGFLTYICREFRVLQYSLDVYYSQSREWRQSTLHVLPGLEEHLRIMFAENQIRMLFNKVLYSSQPTGITYFLKYENFSCGRIEVPSFSDQNNLVIGWNGHLHCISIFAGTRARSMYLHKLDGEPQAWSEIHKVDLNRVSSGLIDLNRVPSGFIDMRGDITALGIMRGHRDEDYSILLNVAGTIVSYRSSDETLVDLLEGNHHQFSIGLKDFHQYNETMAFV